MPYIVPARRIALDNGTRPATSGELNYQLTQAIISYWVNGPRNYQAINDIVGALESAKAEFQRRIVAPYEDGKIRENGDVY